ncbi:glycosyltransferase family 4 protein [Sulfuritalea sp.]|uniref:glycosyltransferase family 4 protein n=1 Tax=Sulfuritalea sp. TaxID=2480090 RepID=UPI001AC751DB|nr:glycosyltransferase family 4 protein [Sulfuritalea sp.]MBN8474446.1 glycosyltransferase family 4 protein [Sulfuritalea sp.]
MKITFVLPVVGMSGGIRVISIYADLLRKRGHEVTLVSPPRRKPSIRDRIRALIRQRKFTGIQPRVSHLDSLGLDHRVIDRYRPIVDDDLPDADVVVATWWETASWVLNLSPSKGKKAYFVQDYGAHEGQPLDAVAATWRYGLHMFTISAWLRGLMLEHTGFDDISFIPNSVDFCRFNSPERDKQIRPTVGFLHDLRSQKGTTSILLALRSVHLRIPDLRVISFGPHLPLEALPEGSEFFHFADDHDLPSIYSRCDVWVFASTLEGFGLPIVEAMACRTPVVATPAGAAPQLLKSGGGRLIPHGDPAAMADAIVEILTLDSNDWRLLSRKAYDSVQGFTWEDATDMFEHQLQLALMGSDLPARKLEVP